MMGVAAWMVQQQDMGRKPMILYGIQVSILLHCLHNVWLYSLKRRHSRLHSLLQLALNLIWNPIFFKGQLTWAVADIAGTVLCFGGICQACQPAALHIKCSL